MNRFVAALALIASTISPALANECPTLQAQIDAALGTRYDPSATNAKALAAEAWALHQGGEARRVRREVRRGCESGWDHAQAQAVSDRPAPVPGRRVSLGAWCVEDGGSAPRRPQACRSQ